MSWSYDFTTSQVFGLHNWFVFRCGPDTRVIPRMLQMYHHWLTDDKEHTRLLEAGVDSQVRLDHFLNFSNNICHQERHI